MDIKLLPHGLKVRRGTRTYSLNKEAIEDIISVLTDAELLDLAQHVEVQYTIKSQGEGI